MDAALSVLTPAAFIVLPNVGGIGGSFIVGRNMTWYNSLKKPKGNPPSWVFGPIWTSLYCGIGYASYLVYKNGGGFSGPAKLPLAVYGSNLLLNWAWTPIFFGSHNLKLAFWEIHLISATTIASGILFYKINRLAGCLFIPYALWLGMATYLSYNIYVDNKDKQE